MDMTVLEPNTNAVVNVNESRLPKGCYCVEFSVDKPRPLYQFKIWKTEVNPMFMVVKEDSIVLPKLKTGTVLNMTYYSNDTKTPKRNAETRIGSITNEQNGRFQGHCRIDLVPVCRAS